MDLTIVDYQPAYQPYFKKFNKAWLEEYFCVEPIDEKVLEHPQENIIDHGGVILFALYEGEIIGTVALKPVQEGVIELTKMAVDKQRRGFGAGKLLCAYAINRARDMGQKKVILYSSSKLRNALGIYRKMGFTEIPLQEGMYGRADIMMALSL